VDQAESKRTLCVAEFTLHFDAVDFVGSNLLFVNEDVFFGPSQRLSQKPDVVFGAVFQGFHGSVDGIGEDPFGIMPSRAWKRSMISIRFSLSL